MRVATKRWGEVTIKKEGKEKNKFESTKSYSIISSNKIYKIEEYYEVLRKVTELTDIFDFQQLISKLNSISDKNG